MSLELSSTVKDNLQKYICLSEQKLIVGVSGGPDSMALLDCLRKLSVEFDMMLVATHLEHGFRGQDSIDDAAYIEAYCLKHKIIYEQKSVDMPYIIKHSHKSSQELSREERYKWFAQIAIKYDTPYIVLGHHQDDQIETVVMRIITGVSPDGLAGIKPLQVRKLEANRQIVILRPLLNVAKTEIQLYCEQNNLNPRLDKSNLANDYLRNKIRNQLIPYLEAEYNPNLKQAILNLSKLADEERQYMEQQTLSVFDDIVEKNIEEKNINIDLNMTGELSEFKINRKKMINLHSALQRRVILLILYYLKTGERIEKKHIDIIINWIKGQESGGYIELPANLIVIREPNYIIIRTNQVHKNDENSQMQLPLNPKELVIGETTQLITGHNITVKIINKTEMKQLQRNNSLQRDNILQRNNSPNNYFVSFAADYFKGKTLSYRRRQNGDKMTVFGMKGHKKVKDILIDEKVPQDNRDQIPLIIVSDGSKDEIVWLAGLRRSNLALTDECTKEFLIIQISDK